MSINKAVLLGRMTADPEIRQTESGKHVTTFSVALDRGGKEKKADFPVCVAWEQTADFICKWFHKGDWIGIDGRIQTRSWEDNQGNKRSATEIVVSQVSFAGARKQDSQSMDDRLPFDPNDFREIDDDGSELPF